MCQANAFYFLFSFKYKKIIVYHIYNIYKYVYVICVCVLYNHIGVQSRAKSYKICPRGVGGWLWLLFTFDRKKDRDRWRKGREKRKGNEEKKKEKSKAGYKILGRWLRFPFSFFLLLVFPCFILSLLSARTQLDDIYVLRFFPYNERSYLSRCTLVRNYRSRYKITMTNYNSLARSSRTQMNNYLFIVYFFFSFFFFFWFVD